LDLATYSGQVEDELHEIESKCIAVYRSKAGEISSLQTELQECQSVLGSLHEMLLGFQADLGGLSGEIRQLQEKSRTLDVQLKNRREAETGLRNFLEHIVVAPSLAHAIRRPRESSLLKSVQELNQPLIPQYACAAI
jgi:chromosome segregation ATPase